MTLILQYLNNVIPLKLTRCQECPGSGNTDHSLPPTNPTLILTSRLEHVVGAGGGGGGTKGGIGDSF